MTCKPRRNALGDHRGLPAHEGRAPSAPCPWEGRAWFRSMIEHDKGLVRELHKRCPGWDEIRVMTRMFRIIYRRMCFWPVKVKTDG